MLDIERFREEHGKITRLRDGGFCQVHWRILGLEEVWGSDTHHCHGRSQCPTLFETHVCRLTMCRQCHRDYHDGRLSRDKVRRALELARQEPVNPRYLIDYGISCDGEFEIGTEPHECFGVRRELVSIGDGGAYCPICLTWF